MYRKSPENSLGRAVSWEQQGSWNHQGKANSDSEFDGDLDIEPTNAFREKAQQRNNGFSQHFCLGDAPSALALMPDNSVTSIT